MADYRKRWVYREVSLWPEDFEALKRIAGRLEKFDKGNITRTSSIMELDLITKKLQKLINKYDEHFKQHSVPLKNGGYQKLKYRL